MFGLIRRSPALSSHWKRFVVVGDVHGDEIDQDAAKAFSQFCTTWKPQIRIANGDVFDCRPLRRGADAEEKRESMRSDWEAGLRWLQSFQPTHFNRGNHDERLYDLAKTGRGVESDFAAAKVAELDQFLAKIGCKANPYDKRKGIIRIGHLKAVHGFGGAGTTAARRHAQAYGSVLVSHFHSIQQASIEGLENRVGRVIGCLCKLDMEYSRAHIGSLVHRHGWAYGVVNEATGDYQVWQAENVNGYWILPSDITVLAA